ncbi:MAG: DUF4197 domain-containing protein, partial [Thiogranum sp.]
MKTGARRGSTAVLFYFLATSQGVQAGWGDWVKKIEESLPSTSPTDAAVSGLSQTEITAGLKEALNVGIERATSLLGQDGGFLNDAAVRIPMPDRLQTLERGLRAAGQDAIADEFVATMNHAAERAVPETTAIFVETIRTMSVADARDVLNGPDDAATRYFREHNQERLSAAILPIVQDSTQKTGVTSAYKRLVGGLGFLNQFGNQDSLDLDSYVTRKTLDGLFVKLADEERLIRENPVARSTDLLK